MARINLHRLYSTNTYGWQRWVFDHLDLPPDARVLELGCGTGDLWLENGERIMPGWRVTLTDRSAGMVAAARRNLEYLASAFDFAVIDAASIAFADRRFDGVIANHMLYHVPDLSAALHEIRRVLRPGGCLYATTNGQRHLAELARLVETHAPEAEWNAAAKPFHLENGAAILGGWFDKVVRDDYPDGLRITEVDPLLDYLRSTTAGSSLDEARLNQIRQEVAGQIATNGYFSVTKAAGLFTCGLGDDGEGGRVRP